MGTLKNTIKKILKESDFDFIDNNPLKGYIITIHSSATDGRFFVDEDGGLAGYRGYDWREGIFSRDDDVQPKIFRTKAEANRMIRSIKEWRPSYMYYDTYEIRKL